MPRPMLRTTQSQTKTQTNNILSATYNNQQQKQQMDKVNYPRLK